MSVIPGVHTDRVKAVFPTSLTLTFTSGENSMLFSTEAVISFGPMRRPEISVCTRPKKLISGHCYTISHLISSALKLISTLYCEVAEHSEQI